MAATVTVTGNTGPGKTLTAATFTGVTEFRIDTVNNVLYVGPPTGPGQIEVDIADENTVTVTKSGNTWTITIAA